jgi:hypothetical protein
MPTLGWWRAGVRVPAHSSPPPPPSLAHHINDSPCHSSLSLSPSTAAAPVPVPATPWLSAMDHEADGARCYELTNFSILQDSTWGGRQGAGERLRAMLRPPTPLLLPPSTPQPFSRQHLSPQRDTTPARAPSRGNLKNKTSAGLFKVCITSRDSVHHSCTPRNMTQMSLVSAWMLTVGCCCRCSVTAGLPPPSHSTLSGVLRYLTRHTSHVTRHTSHVTHAPRVTRHNLPPVFSPTSSSFVAVPLPLTRSGTKVVAPPT